MTGARATLGIVALTLTLLAGCATTPDATAGPPGRIDVVAAEDFWGSIARQLGGSLVEERSLIANPDTDPHDYEPTPSDARALASARVVITNGIGYDPWTDKLLSANPVRRRKVLNVGALLGLKAGDNPHQWYAPGSVAKVVEAVVADYQAVDPAHAAEYRSQRASFESTALAPYHDAISAIRGAYAGTPVGASESVFVPLADALGLDVRTPASFLDAVSEGAEPTSADAAAVDRQIATGAIEVFVYNSQNATPDIRRLVGEARAHRIPVTTVTETLTPRGSTFQEWQTRQLGQLRSALAAATGR